MKEITAHPGCRETVKGVLTKALHDIGGRCKGIVILGLATDEDECANFIRITDLTNAELAYLSIVFNNYISREIHGAGFAESPNYEPPA